MTLLRIAREIFDYLIGFIALATFAGYAFSNGTPTEERWLSAFQLGGAVGMLEMGYLWFIGRPANRLILGGNLWLCAGGAAVLFQQWWWLRFYESFGETSLIGTILLVGVVSTAFTATGFVGEAGNKSAVRNASFILLSAVVIALAFAVWNKGNHRAAAIIPIIALAWLNKALRVWVRNAE